MVGVQLLMSAYAPRKTAERTSDALLHRPADRQLVCRSDRISYGQRLVGKRQLEDAPEEQPTSPRFVRSSTKRLRPKALMIIVHLLW